MGLHDVLFEALKRGGWFAALCAAVGGILHWPQLDPGKPAPLSTSPDPFDPSNPVGDPSKLPDHTLRYHDIFGPISADPWAHWIVWVVAFAAAGAVAAMIFVAWKRGKEGDKAADALKQDLWIPE
jgi:hypothetical protein